jgi:hypothetical protein
MKSYLLRGIVLAAVVLLIVWIARNTYWTKVTLPAVPQGEAAVDPFYSAQHLAESLGAHTRWQRILASLPPPEDVVVVSLWHWGLIAERRERLQRWVESGGRLVLDASLVGGKTELEDWSGITRFVREARDRSHDGRRPAMRQPPKDNCQTLRLEHTDASDELTRSGYQVCDLDTITSLRVSRRTSWVLRDTEREIQALRVPIGRGSLTLINARPFGNLDLLKGDHAALFVAATQLHRGDRLWFLTEEQGASLLQLIWRDGAPVVMLGLLLVALWIWRTGMRLGPPMAIPEPVRRSLAEQIRGTGQFALRFGGGRALHAAAVRALLESADRSIPGFSRLGSEERVARLAQRSGLGARSLSEAINYTGPRAGSELRQSLMLLEAARRAITDKTIHREGSGNAD